MNASEYMQLSAIGIQTLVFIIGGSAVVVRTGAVNKELREDIKAMQEELKSLTKVITTQAVHDERLNEQSKRMTLIWNMVEDLRRGRGYVTERDQARVVVDDEYP